MEIPTLREGAPRSSAEDTPWLVPHQLAALHAMSELERNCKNVVIDDHTSMSTEMGILGDKPGSGKTYIIGALVNQDADIPCEISTTTELMSRVYIRSRKLLQPIATTIIVVPHNITRHWKQHMQRYEWVTLCIFKHADVDIAKHMLVHEPPRCLLLSASVFHPVMEFMRLSCITVKRLVIDEADTIRLAGTPSKHQAAAFYWLVTASSHNMLPGNAVQNRFTVLHARAPQSTAIYGGRANVQSALIRDMLHVSSTTIAEISRLFTINDMDFIDMSFNIPVPVTYTVRCQPEFHTSVLRGSVSSVVIQRLQAGDMAGALESLNPSRADTETNVISAALTQLRRQRENLMAQQRYVEEREFANPAEAASSRARVAGNLARVEESISCITTRIRESTTCPVCYEPIQNKTVVLCCQNTFCLACITAWMANGDSVVRRAPCPMCKVPLTPAQLMVCCEEGEASSSNGAGGAGGGARGGVFEEVGGVRFSPGKRIEGNFEIFARAIAEAGPDAGGRKLLIFSDNDYVFEHMVERALGASGVRCARLKGNADVINKRVREFAAPGSMALMINCTHYGCGMDLSSATDLVLLHKIPDSMYHQVIGRAQRPPRVTPVRVWNFVQSEPAQAQA